MELFRNSIEVLLIGVALMIVCLFFTYAWPESRYGMAAWVQAIGSIAAIGASFGFFYSQKRAELIRADVVTLLTQTKSVIAVISLSRRSILAMQAAVEQMESRHAPGIIPFTPEYLDELRSLFSQFISPDADFMVLQQALAFSDMLMEARHDFTAAADDELNHFVVERTHERIRVARTLMDLLGNHEDELLNACEKYRVNPIAGVLQEAPRRV